ncbi:MAG: hypothetical protein P9L97_11095 [Candidatus Tenebribacter davisii]|jgi:hypothetical protein|nr:hypothetical protein [Candidatus Tenebribacter davisii]
MINKKLFVIVLPILFFPCIERDFQIPFDPDNWIIQNLYIEQLPYGSIEIKWDWNYSGEEGFKIDKRINDGDWIIDYTETTNNEFLDINHELALNIHYRVYAFNRNLESNSIQDSISTFLCLQPPLFPTLMKQIDIHKIGSNGCKMISWIKHI